MPENTQPSSEQRHKAEEAKHLLSSDIFAEALTAIRADALLKLAAVEPTDVTAIQSLQATVRVTESIRDALVEAILRTGEQDGGMTA